jgi:hypothetical protein
MIIAGAPADHLICSFCDACFLSTEGSSSGRGHLATIERSVSIRRVTLDAFWSRKRGTVRQQLGISVSRSAIGEMHGITMTSSRTVPAHHDFGMRMAIGVLEKSLKAGAMKRLRSSRMFNNSLHTNM